MKLRQLFEAKQTVGFIFGRFNPPHKGHKAAWEMLSENDHWYVGTNKSTQGPKDPLPYDVKIKAMSAIWPEVADHIIPHQSWLTLAAEIYKKHGEVELKVYTDEAWVLKTLDQYNGVEKTHGYYNFPKITSVATPRLSSATALRKAVADNDPQAFADAAGVPADTPVDGKPFFDLVAEYLGTYKKEDATPDEEDEFHRKLDKLVHKTFGHSSDEKKKKKKTDEKIDTSRASKIDLRNAIATLEPRQQEVIKMRFQHNMTFDAIGKELGVSRDRARQILERILRQLRHPSRGVTEPEVMKTDEIMAFGIKRGPKRATIKKKPEKFEPSLRDKIAARRKAAAQGDKDAWASKKELLTKEAQLDEIAPAVGVAAKWIIKWAIQKGAWSVLKWILKKYWKKIAVGTIAYKAIDEGWDWVKSQIGEEMAQMLIDNGFEIGMAVALIVGSVMIKRWVEKHGEKFAARYAEGDTAWMN